MWAKITYLGIGLAVTILPTAWFDLCVKVFGKMAFSGTEDVYVVRTETPRLKFADSFDETIMYATLYHYKENSRFCLFDHLSVSS